jgi:hypothetical protein
LSSIACSESAATAPDATSVVVPSMVVVRLDDAVLAVGARSHARAVVVNRDGATSKRTNRSLAGDFGSGVRRQSTAAAHWSRARVGARSYLRRRSTRLPGSFLST